MTNSQTKCNHLGMVYWNGDDWYCKRCGKILEKEILDIAPESELCISCKQTQTI